MRNAGPLLIALACLSPGAGGPLAAAAPPIALDVGHSTDRPGAASARGRPEFAFNRDLAAALGERLGERGIPTVLIGADGTMTDLRQRAPAAGRAGAGFLLSIHHDSVQPRYLRTWRTAGKTRRYADRYSGFSLFVSRHNPDPETSLRCARAIGAALHGAGFRHTSHHAEAIPGEGRAWADAEAGVYFFDDLVVLEGAAMPAVLIEAGIIVNRREELRLRREGSRQALAAAIADGLAACGATGAALPLPGR